MSVLNGNEKSPINLDDGDESVAATAPAPAAEEDKRKEGAVLPAKPGEMSLKEIATRAGLEKKLSDDKTKLMLLGIYITSRGSGWVSTNTDSHAPGHRCRNGHF